jgi:raffinose/stachyose/melibiose transport system substrate-binding protein
MSKILLGVLAAAVVVAAPAFATGQEDSGAPEPVTLRFMTFAGTNAQAYEAIAERYKEIAPHVEVVVEPQADGDEYLRNSFLLYAAADAPEIARFNAAEGNRYLKMAGEGILREMDDLYERFGWYDVFPKGTTDYLTHANGHIYAVNLDVVWTPVVYYNVDLFREVGITAPDTWEEFFGNVEKLQAAGHRPMAMVYEMSVKSHLFEGMFVRSLPDDAYNALLSNWRPDTPAAQQAYKWTDPDGVRIFEMIQQFADSGALGEGFAGLTDYPTAKGIFTSGGAAMYQDGSWATSEEDLYKAAGFELDYFLYPPLRDDKGFPVALGAWLADAIVLPAAASTPAKDKAVDDFLGFLLAKEQMAEFSRITGAPQGRLDFSGDDLAEILSPMGKKLVDNLPDVGQVSLHGAGISRAVYEAQIDAVDQMLTGGKTPREAAQLLQDAYEQARAEE